VIKYIFVENKHKYIHITVIPMDDEDNDKIKVIEAELNKTKEEYKILQDELNETKEHLKKYTAPKRSKTYYENHKEELLEKMKKYIPSPEKLKETNRKAYLKRKEKNTNKLDGSI
jgi:hypothetical protein